MAEVVVGSGWRGLGGVMEVREVRDGKAYLSYVEDPDDGVWESISDVQNYLRCVYNGPDSVTA